MIYGSMITKTFNIYFIKTATPCCAVNTDTHIQQICLSASLMSAHLFVLIIWKSVFFLVSLMLQAYIGKEIHTRRNNFLFHVCRGCLISSVHNLPSLDERCSTSNFLGVNHVVPSPTHRLYCRRISSSDFKTIHSNTRSVM